MKDTRENNSFFNKIYGITRKGRFGEHNARKEVYKEKPFYIYISSNEIYNDETDEKILVQGIIDLYAIDQDDEIILVDYKTDFAVEEKELVFKYEKQLELYRRALEDGIGKKVKETFIYSLYLNKEIRL